MPPGLRLLERGEQWRNRMQVSLQARHSDVTMGMFMMCVGVACLSINDAVAKQLTSD